VVWRGSWFSLAQGWEHTSCRAVPRRPAGFVGLVYASVVPVRMVCGNGGRGVAATSSGDRCRSCSSFMGLQTCRWLYPSWAQKAWTIGIDETYVGRLFLRRGCEWNLICTSWLDLVNQPHSTRSLVAPNRAHNAQNSGCVACYCIIDPSTRHRLSTTMWPMKKGRDCYVDGISSVGIFPDHE
jgi:hypothetical protein